MPAVKFFTGLDLEQKYYSIYYNYLKIEFITR